MSTTDDANESSQQARDVNFQSPQLRPDDGRVPDRARRTLFIRTAAIAGAAAAVVAVLGLTFGAGMWAGSEFGDEHGRDHAEMQPADGWESESSDGQRVGEHAERVQAPAPFPAVPIPAPTTPGRP